MKIQFTKQVIFRDRNGTITHQFEIGDVMEAYSFYEGSNYFVTSVGGIYSHEAKQIIEE